MSPWGPAPTSALTFPSHRLLHPVISTTLALSIIECASAVLLKTAGFSEGLQALRKHWFSTGHNVNNVMSWLQLLKLNRHLVTGQLAAPAAEQLILVFCEHFHLASPPPTPADESANLGTHLELTLVSVACFGLHRGLWGIPISHLLDRGCFVRSHTLAADIDLLGHLWSLR